jgi:hypothetical protein
MLGFAQLMMRKAKIVQASDQIHSSFDGLKTMSRVTTFAGQTGESLTHGPIEAFDQGGVEFLASWSHLKLCLCCF